MHNIAMEQWNTRVCVWHPFIVTDAGTRTSLVLALVPTFASADIVIRDD